MAVVVVVVVVEGVGSPHPRKMGKKQGEGRERPKTFAHYTILSPSGLAWMV